MEDAGRPVTWRAGEVIVTIILGDLTLQAVDAIVNAANNDLELGGGDAGAIARRGGPSIRQSTRRSLELARAQGLRSIAFPAVGTGIAHFPLEECSAIMIEEVIAHAVQPGPLKDVRFVLYGPEAMAVFEREARRLAE